MPVHDWFRVDANVFHHFHQQWTIAICNALNAGLLPPGFSALVEQHAGGLVPDVLALERRSRRNKPTEPLVGILTVTPPKTSVVRTTRALLAARGNRIAIRHRLGDVVCMIEVVSPGNKSSKTALREFVQKSIEFLQQGIHLLIVDLLPPTPRDPQGMHKAIWDQFDEDEPFVLPPAKPFSLSAYAAGDLTAGIATTAYVEFVGIGDTLPDMPAYLEHDGHVPVPLEVTYQTAWLNCPADMREYVETGKLAGEGE